MSVPVEDHKNQARRLFTRIQGYRISDANQIEKHFHFDLELIISVLVGYRNLWDYSGHASGSSSGNNGTNSGADTKLDEVIKYLKDYTVPEPPVKSKSESDQKKKTAVKGQDIAAELEAAVRNARDRSNEALIAKFDQVNPNWKNYKSLEKMMKYRDEVKAREKAEKGKK